MTELFEQHCTPCTGQTPGLSAGEVNRLLSQVPGYALDAARKRISRSYQFKNYYETMAFVNALAWVAHTEDHHPDLEVFYNRVTVSYWTHAVGGLTLNDFVCAAKVNRLIAPKDAQPPHQGSR